MSDKTAPGNAGVTIDPDTTDQQGRPLVEQMDSDALARETLLRVRLICDVFQALGTNPLAAGMLPPGVKAALNNGTA